MFLLPSSHIKVKKTKNRGRGVFALKDIAAGTVIGDYLGRIISDEEGEKLEEKYGMYEMGYAENSSIFPDVESPGVHLLNNSCSANCEAIPYKEHVIYYALRHIFSGEELTISYFLDPPEKGDKHVYPCRCGSPLCRGAMHVSAKRAKKREEFLKKFDDKSEGAVLASCGEYLPPLKRYPKNIKDYPVFDIYGNPDKAALVCADKVMPPKKELRKRIRESGRCLKFRKLNLRVLGIMNGLVILN